MTISSALAMASSASADGLTSSGVIQTRRMPRAR